MRVARLLAVAGLAAAFVLALGEAAGPAVRSPTIVYRSVRLSQPLRPPELYSIPSPGHRRLLVRGGDQPAWSPGRTRIAYAGATVAQRGIWVMNADGTHRRRLTSRLGDGNPTWSPNGTQIAFRRDYGDPRNSTFDLFVVASGGGKPRLLYRHPGANELAPDWSPDGTRIAFQSTRSGEIQIWILNLRTRSVRQLTRGEASFAPDWAPDNRRIAYATRGRIAVVDTVRPRPRLLSTGVPRSAGDPSWSPDGKRIAFQRGGQVLTMRAAGGDIRYATRASWGTNGEPDW